MTETCVRIYDDVVSKEWCKETIEYYEKIKKGYDPKNPDKQLDNRYEIYNNYIEMGKVDSAKYFIQEAYDILVKSDLSIEDKKTFNV